MRAAVMIITLLLMLALGLHSCSAVVEARDTSDDSLFVGGWVGFFVTFLFLLGGAFSLSMPAVSLVVFVFASFVAFLAGTRTDFSAMFFWSVASFVLAIMSYFGDRELKKKEESQETLPDKLPNEQLKAS